MLNYASFANGEMSMSEALGIVITGLAVVFLVLILLVAIFSIMGLFFKPKKKPEIKEEKNETPVLSENTKPSAGDNSVIAAISAALHELLGGKGFVIKSIRPLSVGKKKSGAWDADGRQVNNRPF